VPTYEYRCENCGHDLEEFQSMTADPLVHCPACDTPGLRRRISLGAGMIFKGSGFYETDYKRGGKNDRAAESCPAAEKSGSAPAASACESCPHNS